VECCCSKSEAWYLVTRNLVEQRLARTANLYLKARAISMFEVTFANNNVSIVLTCNDSTVEKSRPFCHASRHKYFLPPNFCHVHSLRITQFAKHSRNRRITIAHTIDASIASTLKIQHRHIARDHTSSSSQWIQRLKSALHSLSTLPSRRVQSTTSATAIARAATFSKAMLSSTMAMLQTRPMSQLAHLLLLNRHQNPRTDM
jgi:hypothetical protein